MFGKEADFSVLERQRELLRAAMTVDGEMGVRLRGMIRAELYRARREVVAGIRFDNGDPRETARSVRTAVYKRIFGGNINILSPKGGQARHTGTYQPPRKLRPGQRGGNRVLPSTRTYDIQTLDPRDRGFILRFVNSGTMPRYTGGRNVTSRGNRAALYAMQAEGDGYRGAISARNFFGPSAHNELEAAVSNLIAMIEDEYRKLFKV